jgi:hypothetical protein
MTPSPRLQLPHSRIGRPVRAVKATSLANGTTGFNPCRRAFRPNATSPAAIRNVRFSSTPVSLGSPAGAIAPLCCDDLQHSVPPSHKLKAPRSGQRGPTDRPPSVDEGRVHLRTSQRDSAAPRFPGSSKPQRDNAQEDDRRGGGALRLERLTEQLTPITANTTEVSRKVRPRRWALGSSPRSRRRSRQRLPARHRGRAANRGRTRWGAGASPQEDDNWRIGDRAGAHGRQSHLPDGQRRTATRRCARSDSTLALRC